MISFTQAHGPVDGRPKGPPDAHSVGQHDRGGTTGELDKLRQNLINYRLPLHHFFGDALDLDRFGRNSAEGVDQLLKPGCFSAVCSKPNRAKLRDPMKSQGQARRFEVENNEFGAWEGHVLRWQFYIVRNHASRIRYLQRSFPSTGQQLF